MPYLENTKYKPAVLFRNGHISTVYAGRIKRTTPPDYTRQKWELDDGDFLLVDYIKRDPDRAVVLCHGLEGNSQSSYINTCADFFLQQGYSVFSWNNRSCGGEMNRLLELYHHGSIKDLDFVVNTISERGFKNVYLLGYSLGGAQILSYLGRIHPPETIKAGVAISTPIHLNSSAQTITNGLSSLYAQRFIKSYKTKIQVKAQMFPERIDVHKVHYIKTFDDIAETFLAPVHGFTDLKDYYNRASPGFFIDKIRLPVLVLNAWDDPMLGKQDYPCEAAKNHQYFFLETPQYGGHCAFPVNLSYHSYAEERAFEFFCEIGIVLVLKSIHSPKNHNMRRVLVPNFNLSLALTYPFCILRPKEQTHLFLFKKNMS